MTKIVKLSILRQSPEDKCPYGLPIPLGCKNVGNLINQMFPAEQINLKEKPEAYQAAVDNNQYLFRWHAIGERCPFANRLFGDDKISVDCTWGQPDAGFHSSPILGSNYYYKHFSGIGIDGLYSIPMGFYHDAVLDQSAYFGPYSIESVA